jgi:hypothetical protein
MASPITCLPESIRAFAEKAEGKRQKAEVICWPAHPNFFILPSYFCLEEIFTAAAKKHLSGRLGYGSFCAFLIRHSRWRTRLFDLEVSNIG